MKSWAGFAVLGVLVPGSILAGGFDGSTPNFRGRALIDEPIQAVPVANSLASEIEQFLKNFAESSPEYDKNDENLRQQILAAVKKAAVRQAAPGIFEVDSNPQTPGKVLNPDIAALKDGRVILYYKRLLGNSVLLQNAEVSLLHDAEGGAHFYHNGEIGSFDAYSRLALEGFLNGFSPALTAIQRDALRSVAHDHRLLPLGARPADQDWVLKVFDADRRDIVLIPVRAGRPAPGFLNYVQALKDYQHP